MKLTSYLLTCKEGWKRQRDDTSAVGVAEETASVDSKLQLRNYLWIG